jgi:regulator of chromosome condensation
VALTELGAIYAWGTFRDSSGVFAFSPTERIALLPTLVHEPSTSSDQAVKIASGAASLQPASRGRLSALLNSHAAGL